jgi:hypothetical protein
MAQYLLECVYPDDNALGGYRSETFPIEADDQAKRSRRLHAQPAPWWKAAIRFA